MTNISQLAVQRQPNQPTNRQTVSPMNIYQARRHSELQHLACQGQGQAPYTCWVFVRRCPRRCPCALVGINSSSVKCWAGCGCCCCRSGLLDGPAALDVEAPPVGRLRRLPCGGPPTTVAGRGTWSVVYGGGCAFTKHETFSYTSQERTGY